MKERKIINIKVPYITNATSSSDSRKVEKSLPGRGAASSPNLWWRWWRVLKSRRNSHKRKEENSRNVAFPPPSSFTEELYKAIEVTLLYVPYSYTISYDLEAT